ncbi:MAG: bacC 2 [Blastococcus sp.]|jgi:NAD(P)-dependent dehydrogenase (short-subunit alcohol dehydrogenase family)|nr:bacC 2 [Blastococcus sp.]
MALPTDTSRLDGRRVIITGGASGMGEGLVKAFPQLGARVVSLDLTEGTGRQIAEASGAGFVAADVSDPDSVDAAMDAAVQQLGGLDVLVHAAGIAPSSPAESTSIALWTRVMTINALGTLLTNQAAFRHMRSTGGQIINFASAAGVVGLPNKSAYAASKGAVVAFTRTAAAEWARYGITVNAIAPAIWTPMYDKTRSEMSPEQLAAHDAMMSAAVPIGGKLGDIETDFVPVLAFYASTGAKFMTGQTVSVDGGTLMVR